MIVMMMAITPSLNASSRPLRNQESPSVGCGLLQNVFLPKPNLLVVRSRDHIEPIRESSVEILRRFFSGPGRVTVTGGPLSAPGCDHKDVAVVPGFAGVLIAGCDIAETD